MTATTIQAGLLTPAEAAQYLRVSLRQLRRYASGKRPLLRPTRPSRRSRPRYAREELDRFIREHTR